jgi:hypothetical protein
MNLKKNNLVAPVAIVVDHLVSTIQHFIHTSHYEATQGKFSIYRGIS